MASTYTTRVGLEKQGDGENANTWGLVLNTNVIDLVDEAVAGYETISLAGGGITLTDDDGTSNQARNFGLKFNGALSADTTVVVPAKEKIYFVHNSTTENFNIFLKPSGGTAVTVVDSGRSMIAAVDGLNVNLLESVDPTVFATKVEVQTLSATMATSIANVSATLETRIAGVSSTLASTSATLNSRINTVSSTMATSINNSNVARASLSATMATSINNSNTAITVVSATMATSINNSNTAITSINNILNGGTAFASAGTSATLQTKLDTTYKTNVENTVSAGTFTFLEDVVLSFNVSTSANPFVTKMFHDGFFQYIDSNTAVVIADSTRTSTTNRFIFDVSSGNFTAAGDITAFSDERLKSNIKTIDGSKVFDMRGVSFTKDGKEGSGVIAQEIEEIAPELVNNTGEYKSVAYGNLVGYLIEAIKILKDEVNELKGK